MENKHSFTFLEDNRIKISSPSKEPIYSGETLDIGRITIHVSKEHEQLFLDNLIVDMRMRWKPSRHSRKSLVKAGGLPTRRMIHSRVA